VFRDRDLPLRLLAAALPAPSGYALTRDLTPLLGGARHRHVASVVRANAAEVLRDDALAAATARGFAASLACDDLDGLTAWLWPRALRLAALRVDGESHLPPAGRAVFATFHIGGGFRVYDALLTRGFRPAVLAALPDPTGNRYRRAIDRARFAYLRRELGDGVLPVGPNAPRADVRSPASHLARGGAVIAVLDVAPAALGLRDSGRAELFGRPVDLPIGALRLAAGAGIPVVPFDAFLDRGRRVVRFHPAIASADASEILARVAAVMEGAIRERPWDWQGWIDVQRLFAHERAAGGSSVAIPPAPEAPPQPAAAEAPARECSPASSAEAATPGASSVPTPAPRNGGVAIVVPIHDATDDARACVESVLRHSPRDARIVLVDDASEDADLRAWLEAVAVRDRRVRLLRNDSNLGFVRSANAGMRAAEGRDVLLMNSDTIATAGFLERLADAARATERTGIVSPFTNNGTIFGVPEFMRANEIPAGLDVDGFADLVGGTSPRRRPEVVTAHGFCMYVRAEVLDAVGVFDEERFGRGYGEENDLCERAKAAGFEVRLCDDAFVYHRGGASFGDEASRLEAEHLAVVERLHPGYRAAAQSFIAANPLAELHEGLRYHLARRAARRHPALLFLLHANPLADPRRENMGGTQYHVLDLVRSLALPRALIAWPAGDTTRVAEVERGDIATARLHAVPRPPGAKEPARRFTLRDPALEEHAADLVDGFGVGAAHVHHLAWWPVATWRVFAARDVPYAYTVQDYYCVCPSWNLLDLSTAARCPCDDAAPAERRRCLDGWFRACGIAPPRDPDACVHEHRVEFRLLLQNAAAVIAPCNATRAIVDRAFPGAALAWSVIPYGYDRPRLATRTRSPGPLRVALVGAVAAPWKGSEPALAAMELARPLDVEWHVFGDSNAFAFPERARDAVGDPARIRFHGRYAREEIVGLLVANGIDATVLLSPWDETFCYTLSESWAAGVPAIVSDRGALAERTRATGAGIVAEDPAQVAGALARLAADPALLEELARRAREHGEPTPAENAARHRDAYGDLLRALAPADRDAAYGPRDRALFEAYRRGR